MDDHAKALKIAIRALIERLVDRARQGDISESQSAAALTAVDQLGRIKLAPSRLGFWYEVFGFGGQNASKYLGGKDGGASSKPISDRHIGAIYTAISALRIGPLTVPPEGDLPRAIWVGRILEPPEPNMTDPILAARIRSEPQSRAILQRLSAEGVATHNFRSDEAIELARHGIEKLTGLLTLSLRDFIAVGGWSENYQERHFSHLWANVLAGIARVARLEAASAPDFLRDWRRISEKWRPVLEEGYLRSNGEMQFVRGLKKSSTWRVFLKVVADYAGEVRDTELLRDVAYLVRPIANGIVVVLTDAISLAPSSKFIDVLFARDPYRHAGPLLLVTSSSAACIEPVSRSSDRDPESLEFVRHAKRTQRHLPSRLASRSRLVQPVRVIRVTEAEISRARGRIGARSLPELPSETVERWIEQSKQLEDRIRY